MQIDLTKILQNAQASNSFPQPQQVIFYQNLSRRHIWLQSEVDETMLYYVKMITHWNIEDEGKPVQEREPIKIFLHNYGGDVDCAWAMIDAIESSITPVHTINVGVSASAAALIFLAGEKRFMTKRARLVIHEGSAQISGDAVKVVDASDSYKKVLKNMKDYILERTQIPSTTLNKKKNNDWELDATYCLDKKVCTDIINKINEVF